MLVDIVKYSESGYFKILIPSIVDTSDKNVILRNSLQAFDRFSFGMDLVMVRILSMNNLSFTRGRRGIFEI